jgi:hypothetical protein
MLSLFAMALAGTSGSRVGTANLPLKGSNIGTPLHWRSGAWTGDAAGTVVWANDAADSINKIPLAVLASWAAHDRLHSMIDIPFLARYLADCIRQNYTIIIFAAL